MPLLIILADDRERLRARRIGALRFVRETFVQAAFVAETLTLGQLDSGEDLGTPRMTAEELAA